MLDSKKASPVVLTVIDFTGMYDWPRVPDSNLVCAKKSLERYLRSLWIILDHSRISCFPCMCIIKYVVFLVAKMR